MSIILYGHPMSSATPVAALLAELDIPHLQKKVNIHAGEQRRPDYLSINPHGKVPTLTVHGAPMFEALAIMLWLAERYGYEQKLWPRSGTPDHMQAMSWCVWAYVTYGSMLVRLQVATQGESELRHESHAAAARAGLDEMLARLDARLSERPWMLGEQYSLTDLIVGSVIGYSAYLGAPVASHPHVQRWLNTLQARPAMQVDCH